MPVSIKGIALGLMMFCLPVPVVAEGILVFAAASTKPALDDVIADYTAKTGDEVVVSYAGSSTLARQIEFGAPADVFLSANTEWMETLLDSASFEGAATNLLTNELVLISHTAHDPVAMQDLRGVIGDDRVAMALVEAVPVGIYGKEALEHLNLWEGMSSQIVQTDNARTALTLVARGGVGFGVVYRTDALSEPAVSVMYSFPDITHSPIHYPVVSMTPAGQSFVDHLFSDEAAALFRSHGFGLADG